MQVPVARKKFLWNVEMMRNSRKVAHESRRNYEVSSVILVNELKSFDLLLSYHKCMKTDFIYIGVISKSSFVCLSNYQFIIILRKRQTAVLIHLCTQIEI